MVWSTLINCQQYEQSTGIEEIDNSILLTDYNQLMSRLGVTTNPSYPSYVVNELNQNELEAPTKGYLKKLVSRRWFTPLWLNINSKSSWRTTYCILRANKLYYYQNQLSLGLDKKYCGQINLDYYDVCEPLNTNNNINIKDDQTSKYTFLIYSSLANVSSSSNSSQSRHIFAADSAFEMFKWINSIQNAIKDARVNRKGPGRRRQDKLKSGSPGGRDVVDASNKHKTAPADGLDFNTDRVEPISILHCEQKNRPRGPKGRRLPGRNGLHSTILNGTSTSDLLCDQNSPFGGGGGSDHLFAINESISLESSTEMTSESSTINQHNFHQRRSRTTTNDTFDTDAGDDELDETEEKNEDKDGGNLYDTVTEEPFRKIFGNIKMKLDEEETGKTSMWANESGRGDNGFLKNLKSKSNGDSNHNNSRLANGSINGYSPISAIKSSTTTTPSPIKLFHENHHFHHQEPDDLKRQLNAIFSNNNQQHHQHNRNQQLTFNLGESIVNIDQNKLTSCLKEIYPTLVTSTSLMDSSSSLSSSLNHFNPQLKSLIKDIESLKDIKKSKTLNAKIQEVVGKLVTLTADYSKSIESFDQYNDQVTKLISSLSTLVSQSTTTTKTTTTGAILSPPSPASLSPPSSPRLVNTSKPNKLHTGNKTIKSPSSTHC